jgi:hypothetical protein
VLAITHPLGVAVTDWLGWKTTLRLLKEYPELIGASFQFAVAWGVLWWSLSRLWDKGNISALNTRIAGLQDTIALLEGELGRTREDLHTTKDELRVAMESQLRIAKDIELLRADNAKLVPEIKQLQATSPKSEQARLTILHDGATEITVRINSIGQANTVLGSTLSNITRRLEAKDLTVGSPTFGKPTARSD